MKLKLAKRTGSLMGLLLVFSMFAMAAEKAPLSTEALKQVIGKGKRNTIVFFQNPMGGPCRAQKVILEKLHSDRKSNFNIANVSTLRPEDQKAFYDYGVRSLPLLVLVDKSGNISRIFSPGIQDPEVLSAALDAAK